MGYCHLSDIQDMLPDDVLMQLTDSGDTGFINIDLVEEAIGLADNLINACCCPRYKMPFEPVPSLIAYISATFAVRSLLGRKLVKMPRLYDERYQDARNMLAGISKGRLLLDYPGFSGGYADHKNRCRELIESYIRARQCHWPQGKDGYFLTAHPGKASR